MKNEVQIPRSVVDAIHEAVERASRANQKKWAAKRSRKRSKLRKRIREWEAEKRYGCWSCEYANRTIWEWCQMEGLGAEDHKKLILEFGYEYLPNELNK